MSKTLFMDTERVQEIADGFETAAEVLEGVSNALEIAMMTLRTTAFMGFVGGMAVERYISTIQPHVEEMAVFCEEIHTDLEKAIQHYMNGDEEGASRFY